nr:putative F-box protein At3g52320 [Ipomoea batatas]
MSASKNTAGVSIPEEIVFEILSKLPAKTLVRFRCVSKLFCALIADHAFGVLNRSLSLTLPSRAGVLISIKSPSPHARRPRAYYTLNFTPRQGMLQANRVAHFDAAPFLCSSSDGLFFCVTKPNRDFVVCNVSTGQRIFLPRLILHYKDCAPLLGYDSESKRYKVLMSIRYTRGSELDHFEHKHWIFTVGVDKSWREINDYCSTPFYPLDFPCLCFSNTSIYIDGVIYSYNSSYKHTMIGGCHIVAFEVGCESFSMITLPDKVSLTMIINSALLQVGGRLALVHVRFPELGGEGLCYMNVWTWNKSKKCWEEITITIPLKWSRMINKVRVWSRMTNKVRLLRYATNHDGEIVLLCVYSEKLSVLIYNMKSEAWRNFDVSGVEDVLIYNSEEEDSSEVTLHNIEDHVFPLE